MKKIVVTSIESFHKVLDCLNSRLNDHDGLNRNENILEHSKFEPNFSKRNTSFYCCYGNQNGQKRTRHDRNQSKKSSRSFQRENSAKAEFSLSQNCDSIQSVEEISKIYSKFKDYKSKAALRKNCEMKTSDDNQNSGKGRKTVKTQGRNSVETLTEEVTESPFQRTRSINELPISQIRKIRTRKKFLTSKGAQWIAT